jgi:hypothetical protein
MTEPVGSPGFADDIVEISAYEAATPTPREFLPWHLPRKQLVRDHQWREQIVRMLDDVPLTDGILRYLGLPGADLLDLRHFHSRICEDRNISLRFLGFNSGAQPTSSAHVELNISLDEVRRLPLIDPMSDVIGDDFALIAKANSLACRKARELGPYDVINLDLCDGFGAQAPGAPQNNYYEAVRTLLSLQARSKRPWLLLLTTRADSQNIDANMLETLLLKYIDNLTRCIAFRDASREKFAIETEEALRQAAATSGGLVPVFMIGLCKWLLALALNHQPPTTVEVRSAFGYRVVKHVIDEDLISLALRFTPTFEVVADPLNLAKQPVVTPDECALAARALRGVARRVDADKKLSTDAVLNDSMILATEGLLNLARYDVSKYKSWLEENRWVPSRSW